MTYKDVIEKELHKLLPQKRKYTKKDYLKLLKTNKNYNASELFFIVKCTAIFYEAEYSKFFNNKNNIYMTQLEL